MVDFREKIKVEQKWGNEILCFDPDSSPAAWKHYENFYTAEHWGKDELKKYIINEPCFFNNIFDCYFKDIFDGKNYGRQDGKGKWHNYVDCSIDKNNYYNRLYALN